MTASSTNDFCGGTTPAPASSDDSFGTPGPASSSDFVFGTPGQVERTHLTEDKRKADERQCLARNAEEQRNASTTEEDSLQNLEVAGVCKLMERLKIKYCIRAIQAEEVDGSELIEYRSADELFELLSKYGMYPNASNMCTTPTF